MRWGLWTAGVMALLMAFLAPSLGAQWPPAPTTTPDGIPLSQFFEVAGRGYELPFQPWAAELKKKRMADNQKDNPDNDPTPWWFGYSRGWWTRR